MNNRSRQTGRNVALVPILAIIAAGVWWRATGYKTDVGPGIALVGLAALIVRLVASLRAPRWR